MRKRQAVRPSPAGSPRGVSISALITALRSDGATMRASQVWRTPGLSWVGTQVRVRIAWPWLNRYGRRPPAVCCGVSHCRAAASGRVA